MAKPDQFISPEQWGAIKNTVAVLNEAEADGGTDLADWFYELRDQLTQLVISTSEPIRPFKVSGHFCYLLDMYVAGATLQEDVAEGSQLVVDWALQTLMAAASMGVLPKKDNDDAIWLVVHATNEGPGN